MAQNQRDTLEARTGFEPVNKGFADLLAPSATANRINELWADASVDRRGGPKSGREYHILSLGAGVQSTALYLLSMEGRIPAFDCAIFADTQDEPDAVYRHLEWLMGLGGPPILVRSKGRLSEHLRRGIDSVGKRFASIPAYTKGDGDEREGRTRRQCSMDYKIKVIERTIRREIIELAAGQRMPRAIMLYKYIGISLDEAGRARRIKDRSSAWERPVFPLIEMFWTRADCHSYLAARVPHRVPRSACVYCPMHSDAEWVILRDEDPAGWAKAIEVDEALRVPGNVVNRNMNKPMYLHRSCQPLALVQLNINPSPRDRQLSMSFAAECMGVCGV